ncbi:hypothetical protein [Idiomarina seosinensis]|uniref:Peptidase M48 domain-containing protein n=1 Tax=Idiomarina seosinensis TaxID=281739 RepID=A0A432ZBZ0_9GAMM|nr:hypothetical protein [Idiomarina seosinensis]MCH2455211.1 hypothetical protein [Idiomarina sp.]RUO75434.1 hypothetical protein CWI81_10710 [Idiomarina seosinensis]
MTTEEIQKAIECWASRPTWFSSHPIDKKNLSQAVSNLKKVPTKFSVEELSDVIYGRVKSLPTMLGTPKDLELSAREFASKIYSKI